MKRSNSFNYFDSFVTAADYACQTAAYLCQTLHNFDPSTFEAKVAELHKIENAADLQKHIMMEHLAQEFVPPLEREDIIALGQELDSVTDSIEDAMQKIYMYNVQVIRPEALVFADLVVQGCSALKATIEELVHFKKSKTIHNLVVEVNHLESECDMLHMKAIRGLFQEGNSVYDQLVWVTIYGCFESCMDTCEHVTDIVESVIMKNT